MCACAGFIV
jgi:hypothetical protein